MEKYPFNFCNDQNEFIYNDGAIIKNLWPINRTFFFNWGLLKSALGQIKFISVEMEFSESRMNAPTDITAYLGVALILDHLLGNLHFNLALPEVSLTECEIK